MQTWTVNCWGAGPLSGIFSMLGNHAATQPVSNTTGDASVETRVAATRAPMQQFDEEAGERLPKSDHMS